MSPERIAISATPRAASLAQGDLGQVVERMLEERAQHERELGLAEGEARAATRAAGALDLAAARLDEARESAASEMSRVALDLALEIARTLLRAEIAAGRYDLEGIVREALSFSGVGRGRCVVHLHPEDARALSNTRFRAGTEIEPDDAVARGSVLVTTPQGLLVRDLDEALRSIRERIAADTIALGKEAR